MKALCAFLQVAILSVACHERSATLGVFHGNDAAPDVVACQSAKSLTLRPLLPVNNATLFERLPQELNLGGFVARKDFGAPMDALPEQWFIGSTTYEASLSEAGPAGVEFNGGWLQLRVLPKAHVAEGTTDRRFWGGEIGSPQTFGHGLFLARVRTNGWRSVQSAFFFTNDRFSDAGTNLGWTGAVFEFGTGSSLVLNSLFHDSSLGRHDRELVTHSLEGEVLLGLASLPGRVGFYVDGTLVNEWRDVDELSPWAFHFTHWINNPAPQAFSPSSETVVFGIDFVAHYAAETCL